MAVNLLLLTSPTQLDA